ncbi:hypothetical protein PTTG_29584, partial [Puccinia triticina 1-1 BBBD Race 1]
SLQDLSDMLKKITDKCIQNNGIQQNGILMKTGGSSGKNAKIFIEIGNNAKP